MDQAQEAKVLAMLTKVCGTDEVTVERDVDLFDAGLLDSLGFTELLVAIEDEFGIVVPPTSVDRDEVATTNLILVFVSERLE